MTGYALVFLGAGIGGVLRHTVNIGAARVFGLGFPWATLAVNVVGSFVMGALAAYLMRVGEGGREPVRLFLAAGLLGGFTTFSAFSLDAFSLWERGAFGLAGAYVLASIVLSILALAAGLALVRALA